MKAFPEGNTDITIDTTLHFIIVCIIPNYGFALSSFMHIIPVMAHLSNSHITLKNQKDDKTDNGDLTKASMRW